jgi:hypothetical protein
VPHAQPSTPHLEFALVDGPRTAPTALVFHSPWIHTMLRCVTLAATLCALALPAAAQVQRGFPASALRGEMQFLQPPDVVLNGRAARLSPGARIRGENNMLQMSGALVDLKTTVHYTVESNGMVRDVWLLSAAERARGPWPTTPAEAKTWQFDAAAQTWSRP